MKHSLRLFSILTVSSALLAGPLGCEQNFEPAEGDDEGDVALGAEGHDGPQVARTQAALGLDEVQREQASALHDSLEADLQPVEQQLREKQEQLRTLWAAEAPDRAAILELGSQIDTLRATMRDRRSAHRVAMNALLTPEQRARRAEHGPGRGGRGLQGDHGRPGPRNETAEEGEAQAQGDGAGHRRGRGLRGEGRGAGGEGRAMGSGHGLAELLGLDEAQQAQVQALVEARHEAGAPTREQMNELREQERALRTSGQADAGALDELHDRMDALMSAERVRQVDFRLAVIQLLTPEQRARFAEMPAAGGGRGMGMGRGRGQGAGHGDGMGPRQGMGRGRGQGAGHGDGMGPRQGMIEDAE